MYEHTPASVQHRDPKTHDGYKALHHFEQDAIAVQLRSESFALPTEQIRTVEQLNAFFAQNFAAVDQLVRGRCFRTPDQADDIVQEVYPRMVRFLGQNAEGIRQPWAALTTIARHLAIDQLRRSSTVARRFIPLQEDAFASPAEQDDAGANTGESSYAILHAAIASLSSRERQVISAVFLNGRRGREVAAAMNLSESYIAELKASALVKLRTHLEESPQSMTDNIN